MCYRSKTGALKNIIAVGAGALHASGYADSAAQPSRGLLQVENHAPRRVKLGAHDFYEVRSWTSLSGTLFLLIFATGELEMLSTWRKIEAIPVPTWQYY